MTQGQSYYDLFGLTQDATAQEIRASYLRLLKQHHPDRTRAGKRTATPEIVPLINGYYSVLRDPQKRAAYDAQLRARMPAQVPRLGRPSRHVVVGWTTGKSIAAAAFLIGVASLTWFAMLPRLAPPSASDSAPLLGWPASHPPSGPAAAAKTILHADQLRRQVHLARSVSDRRAVEFSQACFARARDERNESAMDLCIMFDQAFLYWRKAPGDLAFLPIYFNDEVMQIRHMGALAAVGQDDADARLQDLREEAFRALLQDVSGSGQTLARGAAIAKSAQTQSTSPEDKNVAKLSHNGTLGH